MQTKLPVYQGSSTNIQPNFTAKKSIFPALPSGGLAQTYLEAAVDHRNNTPVHAVITFAAEGDNRFDALTMASLLVDLLNLTHLSAEHFNHPNDWNLVFGPFTSDGMFT